VFNIGIGNRISMTFVIYLQDKFTTFPVIGTRSTAKQATMHSESERTSAAHALCVYMRSKIVYALCVCLRSKKDMYNDGCMIPKQATMHSESERTSAALGPGKR
jgi:hypothetical protein